MRPQAAQNAILALEYFRSLGFEHLPAGTFLLSSVTLRRTGPPVAPSPREGTKADQLKALREHIGDCTRCKLHKGRTHIVFGEGNVDSRIMFVGEGPGREEDLQARPFVGDAGQLLTKLIERMGLKRSDVYIANVVKCRPPMNRDPQEDEIASCMPFLRRQIEIISPDVLVSLGRVSAHTLLGKTLPVNKFSITKERGTFAEYGVGECSIPLMPTFHPAYLLRNPKDKWKTWEDAQAVLRLIGLPLGNTEGV